MPQTLKALREEARKCQACSLWANATQTVFGTGSPHARVMLVGEQPGAAKAVVRRDFKDRKLISRALSRP